MDNNTSLIGRIERGEDISAEELSRLISSHTAEDLDYICGKANAVRKRIYGDDIYVRGLIEFTNYCRNDCLYCGIRRSNKNADRYRLTREQILDCCETGYVLGFRTFVLQGGEDGFYSDDDICRIVSEIKEKYPDCAVTLSIGEKSRESYRAYYNAGADRYLLRHETADNAHYAKLHPNELSLENRKRCLYDLKDIGYQTGSGFMVGSPYQTADTLAEDMLFLKELDPHMVGIGPFIPHHDTPFAAEKAGTLELTLFMVALTRLMLPHALIPATTALGTVAFDGRERGILAGANVVMPNLSPRDVRKKYLLYDNKICTGDEAAECRSCLERRMNGIGCRIAVTRGDYKQ
ncbi:MAG: [FeFe] hydrogenase H-cluster radical SAM maturase HydE [Oscillospiraceae bacterium]|nr:[FeFe] hydrogenase H-cluster radical SAM maturase HydE [Oscillospiraceae bacterium]